MYRRTGWMEPCWGRRNTGRWTMLPQELLEQMTDLQPEPIVVEATGGYQRAVVEALFHAGLSVSVVNPARVRQFARASGLLAKTDKLDAFVLAEFGKRMQPRS